MPLAVNPLDPVYFVLGGTSTVVSLFDSRHPSGPVSRFAPVHLRKDRSSVHVTGTAYDWRGRGFIATYNDELIYRFDTQRDAIGEEDESAGASATAGAAARAGPPAARADKRPVGVRSRRVVSSRADGASPAGGESAASVRGEEDEGEGGRTEDGGGKAGGSEEEEEDAVVKGYRQRYRGHRNDETVKQVNFFGPRSEYVVSGSDCGHIFLWETESGKLAHLLQGDTLGAVNCLEQHPSLPILATSGIENDAKVSE